MNPFTYEYYKKMLEVSKANGYEFQFFDDQVSIEDPLKKIILLRHDIDFSPAKALEVSEIEKEHGVHSTYFFLLNSIFYNLSHTQTMITIKKIIKNGHKIGVHFDEGSYRYASDSSLSEYINTEIEHFEKLFDIKVNIISFHRPTSNVLLNKITIPIRHTYEEIYSKEIKYLSDSRKNMREGDMLDIIKQNRYPKMQILIHPFWWGKKYQSYSKDYSEFIAWKISELETEIGNNSDIYELDK